MIQAVFPLQITSINFKFTMDEIIKRLVFRTQWDVMKLIFKKVWFYLQKLKESLPLQPLNREANSLKREAKSSLNGCAAMVWIILKISLKILGWFK